MNNKFSSTRNSVLVENNAQTIYDHLNDLEKDRKIFSKRWFWELLQNAKDSVGNNSKVSVKLTLKNNILLFAHTGDPFADSDILHLIYHGSSKKLLEGKTGRFGTGFMTTHLLSRKVTITGKLTDNSFFSFDLNREALTVNEQQENLEISYKAFCDSNSNVNYSNDGFDTKFIYTLNDPDLAKEGIRQFTDILPLVLAFNEKIEEININENGNEINVQRGALEHKTIDELTICEQEINNNGLINYVLYLRSPDSYVSILLERDTDRLIIKDIDDFPKLFFDFPLFGTENLGIPFIINSTKFDLKKERDGIYLGEDELPSILENKRLLSDAFQYHSPLIKYLLDKHIANLFTLFKVKPPLEYNWLDKAWVTLLLDGHIKKLLEMDCLIKAQNISLKNIVIPFSEEIEPSAFYEIVTQLIRNMSPEFNHVDKWIDIAKNYAKIQNKRIIDYSFIFDEEKIARKIDELKDITALSRVLGKESEGIIEAIAWLNSFFSILSKDKLEFLTSHYDLIPNQRFKFVRRSIEKPFLDEIDGNEIKDIIAYFGWIIREDLILDGIRFKVEIFQKFTQAKCLSFINNSAERFRDEDLKEESKRLALISFLKWLIENRRTELLKDAFIIVEKQKENDVHFSKRRLFTSGSEKLIAPFSIWKDKFGLYKDIAPRKFVLIDHYSKVLVLEDFNFLQEQELIFISPLLARRAANKVELKLLIKKQEDYLKLIGDKEDPILNDYMFSDIAYLTRSDDGILSKTSDSKRSAVQLLKFLLSQILPEDNLFDQSQEIAIVNEKILLSNSLWISRLRETQWVPVRNVENDKQISSEKPSVGNLTELIKDDVEIQRLVKSRKSTIFFNLLGVSVADILRNSITSEDKKLKWDFAFSQLLTNNKIEPELAVEMLEDKDLQNEYLEKKEKKKRIKANQEIGYKFEEIFKQIFDSEEYKSKGIEISRFPIGSDFALSYKSEDLVVEDQDFIDDQGQEYFFKFGKVLIELKATGKDFAEMTPTQAGVAATYADRYVLAVLPLNSFEINKETVIQNIKFVIKISEPISMRHRAYLNYLEGKAKLTQDETDIKLDMLDGKIRYQVKSRLWQSDEALGFNQFLAWLYQNE